MAGQVQFQEPAGRIFTPTAAKNLKQNQRLSFYFPKLFLYFISICVTLFLLLQIQSLHTTPASLPSPSWSLLQQFIINNNSSISFNPNCTIPQQDERISSMVQKLRYSVTFLPLKDLRFADKALQGHTWFMSSMYDTHEEEEVQYQQFPSETSQGRLLCLKGKDTHDGSWNYYALAWPEALPFNATLMEGLTFVSYNHYNYDNLWHGLSAMVPFVAWHRRNGCHESPKRWILYHWGELRLKLGSWLRTLMEATFAEDLKMEGFEGIAGDVPVCFEKAVVMRHNEGGMSRQKRTEVFDLIRCRAREYCNISQELSHGRISSPGSAPTIGMTLFMRTGARSFKNEREVTQIFKNECEKVDGCHLTVAYSNNLTICEQVKLMGKTDILVSPHGAQLTNMFLMEKNSSLMEFFPKGWLKLAGVGQYVYHWMASWSGMRHEGAWRDPDGEACSYPDDDRRCMSIFKGGRIGYNRTFFSHWAKNVLNQVKLRKLEQASLNNLASVSCSCAAT